MDAPPRELLGKKRPAKKAEEVAARFAAHLAVDSPPGDATVTPLNPGFFQAQRMRTAGLAKKRAQGKVKIREG